MWKNTRNVLSTCVKQYNTGYTLKIQVLPAVCLSCMCDVVSKASRSVKKTRSTGAELAGGQNMRSKNLE